MHFPYSVRAVIARLESCGFEAYAVGGCVRDSLLGLVPSDWDLTTSAKPQEVITCFSEPPFATVVGNGLKHGTVTVIFYGEKKESFELTTYRCESSYSDSRRPDSVYFTSSLEEDLARRDFTINAMAARPVGEGEELIDLYDGRQDLERKILRSVGEASQRFSEDALRIMRGLRFAAVFGLEIEEETAAAIHSLRENLKRIAPERISVELSKLLDGPFAGEIVDSYSAVFHVLFGGLPEKTYRLCFADLPGNTSRLALLLSEKSPAEAAFVLRELKHSGETVRSVTELLEGQAFPLTDDTRNVCLLLRKYHGDVRAFCRYRQAMGADRESLGKILKTAESILTGGICYTEKMLAVNGNDLLAIGVAPGKSVGEWLSWLFEEVISGRLENEKTTLLSSVQHFLMIK